MWIEQVLSNTNVKGSGENTIQVEMTTRGQSNLAFIAEITNAALKHISPHLKEFDGIKSDRIPYRLDFMYHKVNVVVKSNKPIRIVNLAAFLQELL